MTAGVTLRGVSKRFGPVVALDELDLTVDPGEVLAVVGRNGAGKSTLLRVLATTVLADRGAASVAGHDVVSDPGGARRAGRLLLTDERSWYWRLSGRQNLEFFSIIYGASRKESRREARALLESSGLGGDADRPLSDYSAGMRVRLSIGRAFLGDPRVLLLDEPTRSIDPIAADGFRELFTAFARDREATVVLVTHDLEEAADVGDRAIVLDCGRVVARSKGRVSSAWLRERLEQDDEG